MTEQDPFTTLATRIIPGASLRRRWILEGGVSARVDGLELELPGGSSHRVVVRRHGMTDLQRHPDIARDEHRLLTALHAAGLPVPRPRLVTGPNDPFPEPSIVVDFVDGATGLPPHASSAALDRMAAFLARLHSLDPMALELDFMPRLDLRVVKSPSQPLPNRKLEQVRETLNEHWAHVAVNAPGLLHGDFWPGNIIWEWQHRDIAAVIDWEDAVVGDPVADLAKCRLELIWALGEDAMHAFTERYVAMTGADTATLPFWELHSTLGPLETLGRWGLAPGDEARMRHELYAYADRALTMLGAHPGSL
jgi:aminoglycoside phosphotransferase (APT) family kinase protein